MITGFVKGQALTLVQPVIASDTVNYLTARFQFQTREWDGLIKFAHFSNGEYSAHVELTDDKIPASAGLNLTAGTWKVSATGHAYDGADLVKRITTEAVDMIVKESGVEEGEPLPVSPSATEELLGRLETVEGNVADQLAAQDAAVDARLDENEATVAGMLGKVKNERDGSFIKLWSGSEAQYSAATKNADTIYLVGLLGGDSN